MSVMIVLSILPTFRRFGKLFSTHPGVDRMKKLFLAICKIFLAFTRPICYYK